MIQSESVIVIPNPFIEPSFNISKHQKEKLIINIGRLVPSKRHDLLIEAFKIFLSENEDFKLIILGDGPERNKIEEKIKEMDLKGNVHLLGFREDIYQYLSKASLFAFTSAFEGFGLVYLEAMYAGVPIVTFDVPGARDILQNGVNAILVRFGDIKEFANAMNTVLKDRDLYNTLIANGKETLKKYSPEKIDELWFNKILI